ncbi:MAG: hypothetical protein HFH93_13105 [Lachnospiraceae bacterium]|nr:hypothetical protein [Lachnospiraceae bacterium]
MAAGPACTGAGSLWPGKRRVRAGSGGSGPEAEEYAVWNAGARDGEGCSGI